MENERKKEHLENFLKSNFKSNTLFENVYIEHFALTDLNFKEIDTSVNFLGKKLSFPLIINAMTGGAETSYDVNEDLARLCKNFNIAFEVGSQKVALQDEELVETFTVVKDILDKKNIVISNLSALSSLDDVKKAVEMLNSDAISLHLNPAQEIVQFEGDRNFSGILENIENIVKNSNVPIIVKETGCGISKKTCEKLLNVGVKYIDISGFGGTNFIEIENLRRTDLDFTNIYGWGIPTAKCIIDCRNISKDFTLIGSGGIKTGEDIAKAIILGSDMTAIAGEVLRYLVHGGYKFAEDYLKSLIYQTKMIMLLLGVRNIEELKKAEYKIFGKLKIDFLIDSNTKSRISGSLTEFAVTAAIASLPIKAVFSYLVPILFIVVVGFIVTTLFLFYMCKFFIKDYWFEHMIATFGMATGVFLTGILLLRICDPDFKSPVLGNYSLSYTITSIVYFVFLNVILTLLLTKGLFFGMSFTFIVGILFTLAAIISSKILLKDK